MNTQRSLLSSNLYLFLGTCLLLLVPLIAMQFDTGVNWTFSDFIFAFLMIFGTGTFYLFITRVSTSIAYKVATASAMGTGFFLIWSNMAVGIIGSEDNPVNLAYFLVIAAGLLSSAFVRFKVAMMKWVLFGLAALQVTITGVVLVGGFYSEPPSTILQILGVNGFFTVLWLFSGLLFRYAEGDDTEKHEGEIPAAG